jgi:hypothetical protein
MVATYMSYMPEQPGSPSGLWILKMAKCQAVSTSWLLKGAEVSSSGVHATKRGYFRFARAEPRPNPTFRVIFEINGDYVVHEKFDAAVWHARNLRMTTAANL